MRVEHQLRAFEAILDSYDGKLPLHRFLVQYFKQRKQMGSSDRRWANRYVYSYYRLGKALPHPDRATKLAVADLLCNDTTSLVQQQFLEDANPSAPLADKLEFVKNKFTDFNPEGLFPFEDHLSAGIDAGAFNRSLLIQPDLFLSADVRNADAITALLEDANVEVKRLNIHTLSLPNATKLEQLLPPDLKYRVQDLSSQHTANYFKPAKYDKWWDCCAASGGKSMLLHDLEPTVDLLVSDVRESILANLDERFRTAGIRKYQKKVIDLLQNNDQILHHYAFDGIILDAPCTGSGTWGRTPEMLTWFEPHRINFFANLQRTIASNVVKYLEPGKPLIYITCSLFKEENEETVKHLVDTLPLKLESMELIKGYERKADTMFVARMVRT